MKSQGTKTIFFKMEVWCAFGEFVILDTSEDRVLTDMQGNNAR